MTLSDYPLTPIVGQWLSKIEKALEFKNRRFRKDADEGMKFFIGPYEWLYGKNTRRTDRHFTQKFDDDDDSEIPPPRFQMTVNKAAELVQIFGPTLYHRNPIRTVNPSEFPLPDANLALAFANNPMAQMWLQQLYAQGQQMMALSSSRAALLEHYLNYTPNALDLKTESRWAIEEALIKGMGCLWTEVYTPPAGGTKMVGSFYDSVDNLVIDPDMPTLRAAKWIGRKRVEPVWEVERRFGLQPGSLKPQLESVNRQAEVTANPDGGYLRATGQTNDLITYWEIWSKTGMGGRLSGIDPSVFQFSERFGDFVYLAVASGVPQPLNIPSELLDLPDDQAAQQIAPRVSWPTPYWADDDWPLTPIYFHSVPGDPWPMSHLAPGMGELKFLNWAYSFVAGKIRISSRDFIAILEEVPEETRETILRGADYEMIKLKGSQGKSINDLVGFLQHPPFSMDIWHVIEAVAASFDKRVGLTELMYGESDRQMRSASEAELKHNQLNVRPDEMANKVEDAMGVIGRKEAIAARFHLRSQDVAPIMGPVGQALWDQLIYAANPAELMYSLEYRIEAGSTRKPNRERLVQNMKEAMTTLFPFYSNLAIQTGFTGPFNELVTRWCQSLDIKPEGLLLPAMTPPAPPQGQQGGQQQQGGSQ